MLHIYTDALMSLTTCLSTLLLPTVIHTGQITRLRYEATKRLQQSAIHIQAGMRGMSARHELHIRKQPKSAIGTQVNTCYDVGKELIPKILLSHSLNLHIV